MPHSETAQSSKGLLRQRLTVHQAVFQGTRGLIDHRILLGLFAIANVANRGQFAAYWKKTDRQLAVAVLMRR